jgi:hypothetical protein
MHLGASCSGEYPHAGMQRSTKHIQLDKLGALQQLGVARVLCRLTWSLKVLSPSSCTSTAASRRCSARSGPSPASTSAARCRSYAPCRAITPRVKWALAASTQASERWGECRRRPSCTWQMAATAAGCCDTCSARKWVGRGGGARLSRFCCFCRRASAGSAASWPAAAAACRLAGSTPGRTASGGASAARRPATAVVAADRSSLGTLAHGAAFLQHSQTQVERMDALARPALPREGGDPHAMTTASPRLRRVRRKPIDTFDASGMPVSDQPRWIAASSSADLIVAAEAPPEQVRCPCAAGLSGIVPLPDPECPLSTA